jgi:hypothetical protein
LKEICLYMICKLVYIDVIFVEVGCYWGMFY